MRKLCLITTILAFSTTGLWAQGGDECAVAEAIAVAGFATYTVAMDNTTATTGVDPIPTIPCAVVGQFADDIWFSFTPDADGAVDVSTCDPTSWDTDMVMYDGSGGCGALLELSCNGDATTNPGPCQPFYSEFEAPTPVTAGITYYIRVGNWGGPGVGGAGNLTLNFFGIGAEVCDDGSDNDADGLIDCFDPDCAGIPPCGIEAGQCDDGVDNDADGTTDCFDADCIGDPVCFEGDAATCSDGVDNDADGAADCVDPDCATFPPCGAEICDDGVDNDGDGLIDCFDQADCLGTPACPAATNDECIVAEEIAVAGAGTYTAFMDSTTASPGADPLPTIPCAVMGAFDNDIWFSFTPTETMVMEIHTCDAAGWDTDLAVYEGDDCATMTELACDGDSTILTGCQGFYSHIQFMDVTAGQTYKIRVGAWGAGGFGTGTLTLIGVVPSVEDCTNGVDDDLDGAIDCLDPDCFADPSCTFTDGDECFVAIDVFDGANAIDTSTYTASADASDATLCPGSFFGGNDMDGWYLYTATADSTYWVHTCDAGGFDSDLIVYDFTAAGGDCANIQGNEIACNGDDALALVTGCQAFFSFVEVTMTAGNQYLMRVGSWAAGGGGAGTLNITPLLCPPMAGLATTSDCVTGDVTLSWTGNAYDQIEILRDAVLIATVGGGDTSYVDPGLAAGTYSYTVQGICAGAAGGGQTVVANVASYGGESDVIFALEGIDDIDSVTALQAALDANGVIYVTTTIGPGEWGCLGSGTIARAWMMTGTFPNDYRITDADGIALTTAVQNGVGVYMEAGDHWGFAHLVTPYDGYDGVDQGLVVDGDDTFVSMNGADSGFGLDTSDLSGTAYNQAGAAAGNDWTDQISPLAGAGGPNVAQVWSDAGLGYGTGIFYATDDPNGNTISQSWEFGGFGGDQVDLAARYIAALGGGGGGPVGPNFGRGDCNGDGGFNIADAIFTLAALFSGGPNGPCSDACDSNGDGGINIADAIYTLAALFSGGPAPTDPGPTDCGVDVDDTDPLDCASFPPCP